MRVTLSTISKFHTFDLARQLVRLGVLERLFTGRPRWKLVGENLPRERVSTFPVFQTVFEALGRMGLRGYPLERRLNRICHQTLDAYVARHMPASDVFHALAYCGLKSGYAAQHLGAKWICDSPTAHAVAHERLVAEEHDRVGLRYRRKEAYSLQYEVESYLGADCVTVPSTFARNTFLAQGVTAERVVVVPYGADLARFCPVPVAKGASFEVLFVGQLSVHKGIHDIAQAVRLAGLPNVTVTLVGPVQQETPRLLGDSTGARVQIVGSRPKAELRAFYSRADVMVLPSVSEGFGMVIGEALACGCPVIASEHSGGADILRHGVDGFIVPVRSPEAIGEKLVWLYDHPEERRGMRRAALERIRGMGGWDLYGDRMLALFQELVGA